MLPCSGDWWQAHRILIESHDLADRIDAVRLGAAHCRTGDIDRRERPCSVQKSMYPRIWVGSIHSDELAAIIDPNNSGPRPRSRRCARGINDREFITLRPELIWKTTEHTD